MKTILNLVLVSAGYTTQAMAGGQTPIDLNKVHDFFETRAVAINLMKLSGQTPVEPPLNQRMQNMLQVLPTYSHVTIIPVGERSERRVCTKELTHQVLASWDNGYQKTHFCQPSYETAAQFFPTVYDGIAGAMHVHNAFNLPQDQ